MIFNNPEDEGYTPKQKQKPLQSILSGNQESVQIIIGENLLNSFLWTLFDENLLKIKFQGDSFGPNFQIDTDFLIFTFPYLYYTYGAH